MSVAFRPSLQRNDVAPEPPCARWAPPPLHELPRMDRRRLAGLLRGLDARGRALAMRGRWAPVTNDGGGRPACCVAADERAAREAMRRGGRVAWRAEPEDFLAALEEVCAPSAVRAAAFGLMRRMPRFSAFRRLEAAQAWAPAQGALLLLPALAFAPEALGCVLTAALLGFFLLLAALRIAALRPLPARRPAPRLREARLPVYTVLAPVYRETAVLSQLVGALSRLDYPAEKLDVKIIAEADDAPMLKALARMELPDFFEVIVVPPVGPRTKPKALNHALAFARGELVTIYDAEDIPDPGQLRAAAARFAAEGADLACLQARLTWFNPNETWITRMFAIEYAAHFDVLLPAMAEMGLPFPLGGTSNHFRVSALRAAGGWDPHNVTEDADLGFRLARMGLRADVLSSTTWEEACITLSAWRAQRARWTKGWLQTWLVHMRAPGRLLREAGGRGMFVLQAMMGAGVFAALAHPFFLALVARDLLLAPAAHAGPAAAVCASLSAMVLAAGYAAAMMTGALGLHRRGLLRLWPWLFLMPVYWLLLSLAAWQAVWDFLARPHHWRKTEHGLSAFQRGE